MRIPQFPPLCLVPDQTYWPPMPLPNVDFLKKTRTISSFGQPFDHDKENIQKCLQTSVHKYVK